MKKLEDQLKFSTYSKVIPLYVNLNPSSKYNAKIDQLKKERIILEGSKEYLAYNLTQKK